MNGNKKNGMLGNLAMSQLFATTAGGIIILIVAIVMVLFLLVFLVIPIIFGSGSSGYTSVCLNGKSANIYVMKDETDEEPAALEEFVKCTVASEYITNDNADYMKAAAITARTDILYRLGETGTIQTIDDVESLVLDASVDENMAAVDCSKFVGLPIAQKAVVGEAVDDTMSMVLYQDETSFVKVEHDVCRLDSKITVSGDPDGTQVDSLCSQEAFDELNKWYDSEVTELRHYIENDIVPNHYNGLDEYGAFFMAVSEEKNYSYILNYYFDGEVKTLEKWLESKDLLFNSVHYGPLICSSGEGFPKLNQCDSRWGSILWYKKDTRSICRGGCGPTSATIVVSGVAPDLAAYLGIDTPPGFIEAAGMEDITNNMNSILKKATHGVIGTGGLFGDYYCSSCKLVGTGGGYVLESSDGRVYSESFPEMPVIILVGAEDAIDSGVGRATYVTSIGEDGKPKQIRLVRDNGVCKGDIFTNGGHFLVLVGINELGEIIVRDPGSRSRTEQTYSAECINGWTHQFYQVKINEKALKNFND